MLGSEGFEWGSKGIRNVFKLSSRVESVRSKISIVVFNGNHGYRGP